MSALTTAEARRIVQRARFGTYLVNQFVQTATQALSRELPRVISDYNFQDMTKREMYRLSTELREQFNSVWGRMWSGINSDLDSFAMDEAEFIVKLYSRTAESALLVPASTIIESAIANSIISLTSGSSTRSGVWKQFISQNTTTTYGLVDGVIKSGFSEGNTNQEIVTLLRGRYNRSTKQYVGGVINNLPKARADSLVRTGVAHYSAVSRDKTIQANSDLFESRILYATFDSRTSDICIDRHLKEWPIADDKYPRLPFHFNERSVYVYRLEGEENPFSGKRQSKGAEGGQQVDADLTMDEWLKSQPKWFVEDTLGKTKAELFLDGGLPIDKFTDLQGRSLTLDQLRATTEGAKAFGQIDG